MLLSALVPHAQLLPANAKQPFVGCIQEPRALLRFKPFQGGQRIVQRNRRSGGDAHACCRQVVASTSTDVVVDAKAKLEHALEGLNRGILGVKASQAAEILSLLEALEAVNPLPSPTQQLERVAGDWKLLYSTISIQGAKRTKLGLREVITLGDFVQRIDTQAQTAVNEVQFSARGLALLRGALTITATYRPASPQRVEIEFVSATLVPDGLQKLFEKNYDLLLSIFNPQGWLDITYVDDSHRIGRDDKGNVFYLERC